MIITLLTAVALTTSCAKHVYKADINNDRIEDKVVANETLFGTEFYSSLGTPKKGEYDFQNRSFSERNIVAGLEFKDYNNDGFLDIVTKTSSPHRKYKFLVVGINDGYSNFKFKDIGY